jgi:hypothetical protein
MRIEHHHFHHFPEPLHIEVGPSAVLADIRNHVPVWRVPVKTAILS